MLSRRGTGERVRRHLHRRRPGRHGAARHSRRGSARCDRRAHVSSPTTKPRTPTFASAARLSSSAAAIPQSTRPTPPSVWAPKNVHLVYRRSETRDAGIPVRVRSLPRRKASDSTGRRSPSPSSKKTDAPPQSNSCAPNSARPIPTGRRIPEACSRQSNFHIACDMVIPALGQSRLTAALTSGNRMADRSRWIAAPVAPAIRKYYAGGDCVNGGREVVDAVADGKARRARHGEHGWSRSHG